MTLGEVSPDLKFHRPPLNFFYMALSTSEQLSYTTTRIECFFEDGSSGTGTGFFFEFKRNEDIGIYVPVIITNKHVISER